jgi:3-oxoacyl-[acyl-carrier protein] reductase
MAHRQQWWGPAGGVAEPGTFARLGATRFVNQRELTGRTALVTGVTRRAGIGAAIARELGQAGARLFVTFFRQYDRQQVWGVEPNEPESLLSELRSIAEDVEGTELDLSQPASPAELFRQALERFGSIDILVNNAAHWEEGGIDQVRADQLDRHYAVNVRASVLLCAEFARNKKRNAPGRIINITSGQNYNPMPGQIAYVVTKSALDALTLALSSELAGAGITVNAVDPGPTDTGWISDELRSKLLEESPEAISSPETIGRLVRLLAGDDAASITGKVIRAQAAGTAALFTKGAGEP